MNFAKFKSEIFSVIDENDPYREAKKLQLRNWCYSFFELVISFETPYLPFLLDVLSEKDCWENTDSVHCVQLNRRKVARKMVQVQSWMGKVNTLHISERFKIASRCCLEEDVDTLFDDYKRQYKVKDHDFKKLAMSLNKDISTDPFMTYWLYMMGGCTSKMPLKGNHIYEYGLYLVLNVKLTEGHYVGYVEGVEFFWNKIKLLPDWELNDYQKREIFIKTTVRAASIECANCPEIFEFCFSQLNPEQCLEVIKRASDGKKYICSSILLRHMRRFDLLQKLFDCLEPNFLTSVYYHKWLSNLLKYAYSKHYANEVVKLLMHIWRKEGFDEHRDFVLRNEVRKTNQTGNLLLRLVTRNYMEPVWAILDQATPDQLEEYRDSDNAGDIHIILEKRKDHGSIIRLFCCP